MPPEKRGQLLNVIARALHKPIGPRISFVYLYRPTTRTFHSKFRSAPFSFFAALSIKVDMIQSFGCPSEFHSECRHVLTLSLVHVGQKSRRDLNNDQCFSDQDLLLGVSSGSS